MTLCTRKRRCKSKETSIMYLFPGLSETHVVGKNEKACISVPTFLFTHFFCLFMWPWHVIQTFENVSSSVKWEWYQHHRRVVKDRWASMLELMHILRLIKTKVSLLLRRYLEGWWWFLGHRNEARQESVLLLHWEGEIVNVWMDLSNNTGIFLYVWRWTSTLKAQSCHHWFQNIT